MTYELGTHVEGIASPERQFAGLEGTYIGVSPIARTDEELAELGEIKVTIGDGMLYTSATGGLGVSESRYPLDDFMTLPPEEVADRLGPGGDIDGIRGYKLPVGGRSLTLLFHKEADEDDPLPAPVLTIDFGEMTSLAGPTFLFGPRQVAAGVHERVIREIEDTGYLSGIGRIPRLTDGISG